MNKRLGIAIAAGVLALLGVIALVAYAHGANDRAYKDAKLVSVLQVKSNIPAGTTAARLGSSVKIVKIPAEFRSADALTSLTSVAALSTNVALKPGEQVLRSRFGANAQGGSSTSNVPDGYQELSISMASSRIAGGNLKAGDRVGIIATYGGQTNFLAQQVLVSRVNGGVVAQAGGDNTSATLLVTLAVKTIDAEKVANALDNAKMSLTLQNDKTDKGTPKVIGSGDVLK